MTPEHKAEAQELFDQVVAHLRTQGKKSETKLENGLLRCLYRHPDGLKCAVGCLIPDADYDPLMEKKELIGALELITDKSLKEKLLRHKDLLHLLQSLHDDFNPLLWGDRLSVVAKENNLTLTPLTA